MSQRTSDPQVFYAMLRKLFKDPCLILMLGKWRQGKTDTSLLIGYLGLKWGLLQKVASNIWTYENPLVEYVTCLPRLKRWLHRDRTTKLFIFDEALTHLPSREAMSRKNVAIMKLFTELSKAHGRMIFCAQNPKVDSSIKDLAFLRATMEKLDRKFMTVHSDLFPPLEFEAIPRSPIRFDKDRMAEFTEIEGVIYSDLSLEYKVALRYSQGNSFGDIGKELDIPKVYVKRNLQKVLKSWLGLQKLKVLEAEKSRQAPMIAT